MTCEEVERDELVERYVLGRLEKPQRDAFEDHYFNCSTCLERLQVVDDLRGTLSADAARAQSGRWRGVAAGLAAAAALVLAVRVGQEIWRDSGQVTVPTTPPPRTTPAPALPASLGRVDLPRYTPLRLRSTPTEAQRVFQGAMIPYTRGNCDTAIPELRRSLQLDDSLIQARFYLAACELQAGRIEEAEGNLKRVVAAGESPYLEDALFLAAKARIRKGDIAGAREELARVVALKGDRSKEASELLEQLR